VALGDRAHSAIVEIKGRAVGRPSHAALVFADSNWVESTRVFADTEAERVEQTV
jgi:hypothetical protein